MRGLGRRSTNGLLLCVSPPVRAANLAPQLLVTQYAYRSVTASHANGAPAASLAPRLVFQQQRSLSQASPVSTYASAIQAVGSTFTFVRGVARPSSTLLLVVPGTSPFRSERLQTPRSRVLSVRFTRNACTRGWPCPRTSSTCREARAAAQRVAPADLLRPSDFARG